MQALGYQGCSVFCKGICRVATFSLSHCWPELQEALATVQLWGLFRLKKKTTKLLLFINQGCNFILLWTEEAEKPLYLIFDFPLEHEVDFLIITFCFSYLGPNICPCSTTQQLLPSFLEQCHRTCKGSCCNYTPVNAISI